MATELLGRGVELDALREHLGLTDATPAGRGEPRAALLAGDAGMGKTRLLSELAAGARKQGWRVMVGHCLDFADQKLPYLPFSELVGRFALDRAPHAAIALTTDSSFLTACANDYGFEDVFARQIEALGRPGDVLFALSTGGRSPNVLKAVDTARGRGLATYGLTGAGGAALAERCDEAIRVPHSDPARIQEVHLFLGHLLCGGIEDRLAAP